MRQNDIWRPSNLRRIALLAGLLALVLLLPLPVLAQGPGTETEYRQFLGLDSRLVVWVVAELHLMFAAFVLGVPMFAVVIEAVGARTGDDKYDKLAKEFTSLLAAAFSTTAALGGLLAFVLFGLYPRFMSHLADVFNASFYWYALIFFGEGFTLYLYYYSWERMKDRKGLHLGLGVLLNVFGTLLMFIANGWATFMMSPVHIDAETGAFTGTLWQAINNPLWTPLNLHRLLGNLAFGGLIAGAYAAVKFLGARSDKERAYYDWMGYTGNFIALIGLIPLPFAGYYMGREVYSASAVMGNNMMGGDFSWAFIVQAILIGALFLGANFYLWIGMQRIPGAERYQKYIKYLVAILIVCFAIWLTPHNLPLSSEEQIALGGQYHPTLKFLGLMAAKNAVVNFIIISTFLSFLVYRRANKGQRVPFSQQGRGARVILSAVAGITILILGWYAGSLLTLDPAALDLDASKARYFVLPAALLAVQILAAVVGVVLTFRDRGILAQMLYLAVTVINAVLVLGVYGFVVMTAANPFLRNVAVAQWLIVMSALLFVTAIDVFLFRGAEQVGGMRWGRMPNYSQYTLIFICLGIVMLIALMGFIRSGLRENWHIWGVLQDTTPGAYTPSLAEMARMIALIDLIFLALIAFVFWLNSLGEKPEIAEVRPSDMIPGPVAAPIAGGSGVKRET